MALGRDRVGKEDFCEKVSECRTAEEGKNDKVKRERDRVKDSNGSLWKRPEMKEGSIGDGVL